MLKQATALGGDAMSPAVGSAPPTAVSARRLSAAVTDRADRVLDDLVEEWASPRTQVLAPVGLTSIGSQ